jgi:soluble lytic murein transglycosylase
LMVVAAAVTISIAALRAAKKAAYPLRYLEQAQTMALRYELPLSLVLGVIHTESGFRPEAVSPVGAVGLMQIMPDTGAWIAGKLKMEAYESAMLTDTQVNIEMGCWYLQYLLTLFPEDMNAVLAGYNAGQNRVRRWLTDPANTDAAGKLAVIPIKEASDYVEKVLYAQKVYQTLYKLP